MYATSGRNISDSAQVNPGVIQTTDLADNAVTDDKIGAHTTTKLTVPTTKLSGTILEAQIADLAVALGKLKSQTQGMLLYFGAAGVASLLSPGNAGEFLSTGGAGANPSWASPAASFATGSKLIASVDTPRSDPGTTPTKNYEWAIPGAGVINVGFEIKQNGGGGSHAARVYVNGVAVGTNRTGSGTTYVAYTEDITVAQDDLLQVYLTGPGGGLSILCQNVRLKALHYPTITLLL